MANIEIAPASGFFYDNVRVGDTVVKLFGSNKCTILREPLLDCDCYYTREE
jgi:hypothetical protein